MLDFFSVLIISGKEKVSATSTKFTDLIPDTGYKIKIHTVLNERDVGEVVLYKQISRKNGKAD